MAKKLAGTKDCVLRAGSDLAHAVQQMKERVEAEEKEGLLFHVDDQIISPYRFSEKLTVRVSYRWRQAIEDDWTYGSITFSYDSASRPDSALPTPKRKPSATKLDQERQEKLYRVWEYLKSLALYSVREYFRDRGDGNTIPPTIQAKTDPYSLGLNNYSAQFWGEHNAPASAK